MWPPLVLFFTWCTGLAPTPVWAPAILDSRAIQDPAPTHDGTLAALESLLAEATAAKERGDHSEARAAIVALIEQALVDLAEREDGAALALLDRCGERAEAWGELGAAERAARHVLAVRERVLPADHPDLLWSRQSLAVVRYAGGDLHGARAIFESVVQASERVLAADHPDLLAARQGLAATMHALGDLHGARAQFAALLELQERSLPADHPNLLLTRENLAVTIKDLGDLRGARALFVALLEARERALPADHPHLLETRANLATTMHLLGDLTGARVHQEAVLEGFERMLPEDHPNLTWARGNLAATLHRLGDLSSARELFERVLESRERSLPAGHPDLLAARQNLAATVKMQGDLQGARALEEAVLDARQLTLPEDHPDLLAARRNLAVTKRVMGDFSGARVLEEAVLAARERTLPADHPDLLEARLGLAATLKVLGDLSGARELEETVLSARERILPADHEHLQMARANLAVTRRELGDLEGALALQELVLETRAMALPEDHPDLLAARRELAWTIARHAAAALRAGSADGDWPRAQLLTRGESHAWVRIARQVIQGASVREAEERLGSKIEGALGHALSWAAGLGLLEPSESHLADALILSETTRAVGWASARLGRTAGDPAERERLRGELRAASEELAELAQRGAAREEYHRARSRREAAERELVHGALPSEREGLGFLVVGVQGLAAGIDGGTALVGYRRYLRSWLVEVDAGTEGQHPARFEERSLPSLGAFVLRNSEEEPQLAFVDLGAAAAVESLASDWRAAIRATPDRGLGIGGDADPALSAGHRLRGAVWDPLLEHLGGVERVIVALDDVLHLVPLDALPLDDGDGLVGDRWRIEQRLALWELLDAPRPAADTTALVSVGGASFNSAPVGLGAGDLAALDAQEEDAAPSAASGAVALLRGGAWERGFAPLAYTGREAHGLAALFEETFEDAARALVLDRRRASRSALMEAAPRARYLHVATHGWFAPESVRSWTDVASEDVTDTLAPRLEAEETVRGMSPMLLCGLALAGANLAPDSLGRVPGLVTAEELSTLDLTGCELAVLSACDTNVGERRAGQGVASLQKALHMAGARSVITSLWKVPDEATAELMLDFYRRLWVERKPKHQALWEAKQKLRNAKDEAGRPRYTTRDWAAWVLTGLPD